MADDPALDIPLQKINLQVRLKRPASISIQSDPVMEPGTTTSAPSQRPLFRRAKRWRRRMMVVLASLLFVWLAGPSIIGRYIAYKLRSEISQRLNAHLELGGATYLPPYGLRLDHASFIADDPVHGSIPLIDVDQLQLTLAKLPLGSGPVVIQKINIRGPVVHLVRTSTGYAGAGALLKPSSSPAPAATSAAPPQKLSDLFELRHLMLTGGEVDYQDTRRPGNHTTRWSHLDTDLSTTPTSRSQYNFDFTAKESPLASISATGSVDIDSLLLKLGKFSIDAHCDPAAPAPQLPPRMQDFCRRLQIVGDLQLSATATIPFTDANHSKYSATARLRNGSCRLPGWSAPISPVGFTVQSDFDPSASSDTAPDIHLQLSNLDVACANQRLAIHHGDLDYEPAAGSWILHAAPGLAEIGDGPDSTHDAHITAHLPFVATGFGKLASPKADYTIDFVVEGAAANFTAEKLPLRHFNTIIKLRPTSISTEQIHGDFCGGTLSCRAGVDWSKALTYDGQGQILNINLHQLGDVLLTSPQAKQRASGVGDLRMQFSGSVPPGAPGKAAANRFAARGDFDVRGGHFMQIPILKDVLRNTKDADAATVGEAAAIFHIAHRRIFFDQAAASSPALGVQGSGQVNFDGKVDMNFVMTPLADWRNDLEQTRVPFLSTIGAFLAGQAQQAVNAAERVALYQFRVTGTVAHPKTEQVPIPVLTDAMRPMFQMMSGSHQDDSISQELRRRQAQHP